ncbi:MAG: hypothetical protein GY778_26155 [bacterium]|nr:hypothetical protein [bacterium]
MNTPTDPVDSALQSLRDQRWPGNERNHEQLEHRLMQEYQAQRTPGWPGRHRLLVAGLAVAVLASAGFGAAAVMSGWFVTTEINGQVIDTRTIIPDETGHASYSVPLPEVEGDGPVTLSFSMEAGEDTSEATEAGTTVIGLTAEIDGDVLNVDVQQDPPDENTPADDVDQD